MARAIRMSIVFALLALITLATTQTSKADHHIPYHRTTDIPPMTTPKTKVSITKALQEQRQLRTENDPTDNPNTPAHEHIIVSTNNISSTSYTTATESFEPTGKNFPENPVARGFGGRSIVWFGKDVPWNKISVIITVTGGLTDTIPIVSAENRQDDPALWGGWETTVTSVAPHSYSVTLYNPGEYTEKIPHFYQGMFVSFGANAWFNQSVQIEVAVKLDNQESYRATSSVDADPSGIIFPDQGAEWLNNQLVPWSSQPTSPVVCLAQCQPVPPQVLNVPAKRILLPLIQN